MFKLFLVEVPDGDASKDWFANGQQVLLEQLRFKHNTNIAKNVILFLGETQIFFFSQQLEITYSVAKKERKLIWYKYRNGEYYFFKERWDEINFRKKKKLQDWSHGVCPLSSWHDTAQKPSNFKVIT